MAHVIAHQPHQVPFHTRPVNHAPSPLGFGFGLSSTPATSAWPAPHVRPPTAPLIAQAHIAQNRVTKRRLEHDDEEPGQRDARDDAMERSPTPERPKRAAPKRARTTPGVITTGRGQKENQAQGNTPNDGSDVDVGVLLASLPRETLLPVLTSLISAQPTLKASVLSLIPRPTLDTATQAIERSARKLLDAFPYSTTSGLPGQMSTPFSGAATGFGAHKVSTFGGFGSSRPSPFGHAPQDHSHTAGMRDEYILSRLRPHVQEFVSACSSYLPYFSYVDTASLSELATKSAAHIESHAFALQSQHKDKSHPSETFLFLHALMTHALAQPPLTQSSLLPQVMPRLVLEWKAWVARVDQVVNREGGMFGQETVRSWERGLDELAQAKGNGVEVMREVRDQWVSKVGWLVGRQSPQPMDE